MPKKYVPKGYITIELWSGDEKMFSHVVRSMEDVPLKVAQFRTIALNNGYSSWATYIVQPVFKPGIFSNCSRKLSSIQQEAWNQWEKKKGFKYNK